MHKIILNNAIIVKEKRKKNEYFFCLTKTMLLNFSDKYRWITKSTFQMFSFFFFCFLEKNPDMTVVLRVYTTILESNTNGFFSSLN